jgi:hypothetical protein
MRTFILSITFIALCSANVFAQKNTIADTIQPTAEEEKSSVYINGASFNFIFKWDKKADNDSTLESHYPGFGMGISYSSGLSSMNYKSYFGDVNSGSFDLPINKNFVFVTGGAVNSQSYIFKENVSLKNDKNGITQFIYDSERHYKSSKFELIYVTVPFILEYQTKIKGQHHFFKEFFVYAGVEAMIKVGYKSEARIYTNKGIVKEKYKGLNIRPLNFRFVLRAGFEHISYMAYYQPFSIFRNNRGPDIRTFGVEVMLDIGLFRYEY